MCKHCRWLVTWGPVLASHARAQHHLAGAAPSNVRTLPSTQSPLHESGSATGLGDGTCTFCKSIGPLTLQALGAASPRQARGSHHSGGTLPSLGRDKRQHVRRGERIAERRLPRNRRRGRTFVRVAWAGRRERVGMGSASESPGGAGPGGKRARRAAGPSGKIPIPGLLWPESRPQGVCRGSRTGRPRSRRARRTRSPATPACVSALRVLR